MLENNYCFFGHREIEDNEELRVRLRATIEHLIEDENVDTFLFGSKSRFNDVCYKEVTEIKKKHPHIKRVFVRAEYPDIHESYKEYLLESFEDTYFPEKVRGAGKASYLKRNYEMIDNSRFCVVYCDESYTPNGRKSGTRLALNYAERKKRHIINFP